MGFKHSRMSLVSKCASFVSMLAYARWRMHGGPIRAPRRSNCRRGSILDCFASLAM